MPAMRLAPTLLVVMLAAMTLAPLPGRIDVLRVLGGAGAMNPGAISSYDALMTLPTPELTRRVAILVGGLFGVAPPDYVVLHRYPSQRAFARGLVDYVGISHALAVELAQNAIGVATPGTIFLLADGEADDRVRLVAHELTHVVQHALAGPAARPPQWMMEGTAEWAALTLLERLGADGAERRAAAARAAAAVYLAGDPGFMLERIRRGTDFRRWQRRIGARLAYHVAYALVDRLARRHGVAGLGTYFRAFRLEHDAERNFRQTFGLSPAAFAAQARIARGRDAALGSS